MSERDSVASLLALLGHKSKGRELPQRHLQKVRLPPVFKQPTTILNLCLLLLGVLWNPSAVAGGGSDTFLRLSHSSPSGNKVIFPQDHRLIIKLKDTFDFSSPTSQSHSRSTLNIQSASGQSFSLIPQSVKPLDTQVHHIRQMAMDRFHVIRLVARSVEDIERLEQAIRSNDGVEYIEQDIRMYPKLIVPNDEFFNYQWSLFESRAGIDVPKIWPIAMGEGITVAVLDTGYTNHRDLNGQWIGTGYDFISDPSTAQDGDGRDNDAFDEGDGDLDNACGLGSKPSSWHGTHVAGIVAAQLNNNIGIVGVAPKSKILPVRVLGRCGGFASDIADAIIWASGGIVEGVPQNTTPAQVINLSLGGQGTCSNTTQAAVDAAVLNGSTMIVAAGNENEDAALSTPANCQGVLTVGAVDRFGQRAFYSNFGDNVDISAPGGSLFNGEQGGIVSTVNDGAALPTQDSFAFYQGTSMAAPHVSGFVALLYEVDRLITPQQVKNVIRDSARAFPQECTGCGAGILSAPNVMRLYQSLPPTQGTVGSITEYVGNKIVDNLQGTQGSWRMNEFEVLAGTQQLIVNMLPQEGSQGDADLYLRFNQTPSLQQFDCHQGVEGNTETCTISQPEPGIWFIGVRARSQYQKVAIFVDDSN